MKRTALMISVLMLGGCVAAFAQNPVAGGQKFLFGMVKNNIIKSAEKMPEENYSYKPTPDVRSFGQLIGHVADAQYMFCAAVLGKPNPAPGIEKSKTAKAGLVQALKDAFAYCDQAYDGLTDVQAAETVKFFGGDQAKATVLSFNTAHDNEHYGNIVTYLRLKGLVPPSSEKRLRPLMQTVREGGAGRALSSTCLSGREAHEQAPRFLLHFLLHNSGRAANS